MKTRNKTFKTIIKIILLVAFILIVSANRVPAVKGVININKLKIEDFFSVKNNINLDDLKLHLSIETIDDGYDVYVPSKYGYRYGPSIIYYEDGTMDAFFSSNGNKKQWDWITYKHFDGNEWSKEKVVLKPTENSKDHYSTCDPGAVYFNGYYYLGYTSTENSKNGGVENCVYVARSIKPSGPYEKWNGEDWGGKPEPIIIYDKNDSQWGAGEISFVIVKDKLYCYYSWISSSENCTKLAIADLDENWPLSLQQQGTVINKVSGQDSCDVIYVDNYSKFLAFCIESRFLDNSCVAVYESSDGINFNQVDRIDDIHAYAHNMGISKKSNGHVDANDDLIIGYAYGTSVFNVWGKWPTKFQTVRIKKIS